SAVEPARGGARLPRALALPRRAASAGHGGRRGRRLSDEGGRGGRATPHARAGARPVRPQGRAILGLTVTVPRIGGSPSCRPPGGLATLRGVASRQQRASDAGVVAGASGAAPARARRANGRGDRCRDRRGRGSPNARPSAWGAAVRVGLTVAVLQAAE